MTSVGEILAAVERLAPASLAEEWDNRGLQVGDAKAGRVLVALPPLPEVFQEAEELGADFLLFHQPLTFGPVKTVDTGSYPGNLVSCAIRNGLAVCTALARTLGLVGPLKTVVRKGDRTGRGARRSGGSFVPDAAASGARAYVTGDLGYQDAPLAEALGLAAIDAGHAATELPSLEPLAERLAKLVDVPVAVSRIRR